MAADIHSLPWHRRHAGRGEPPIKPNSDNTKGCMRAGVLKNYAHRRRRGRQINGSEIDILVAKSERQIRLHHIFNTAAGYQPALTDDASRIQRRPYGTKGAVQVDVAISQPAGAVKQEVPSDPASAATQSPVPIGLGACPAKSPGQGLTQSAAHRSFETSAGQICLKSIDPGTLHPIVAGMSAGNPTASSCGIRPRRQERQYTGRRLPIRTTKKRQRWRQTARRREPGLRAAPRQHIETSKTKSSYRPRRQRPAQSTPAPLISR